MDKLRLWACEGIGTFILVFIGVSSVRASVINGAGAADLLGIAVAFGAAVAFVVSAMGHISGAHINPAVTLSLLAVGRVKPKDAVAYVAVQLLGAVLAAYACDALFGEGTAKMGATFVRIDRDITLVQGA